MTQERSANIRMFEFLCLVVLVGLTVIAFRSSATAKSTQIVIHDFVGTDGENPVGDLIADAAGNLYGVTQFGGKSSSTLCPNSGSSGCGAIYQLSQISGHWKRTLIYRFSGGWADGYRPEAGLVMDGSGNLYGTTAYGGNHGAGTVFKLSPTSANGWQETVLFHFGGANSSGGSVPLARLALDAAGNLYGTTSMLGNTSTGLCASVFPGCGTAFKLSPSSGSQWTESVLYSFSGGDDGAVPLAGLTFDAAGNLYGTTSSGGTSGCRNCGAVFELSPNSSGGWTEKTLYSFAGSTDGATPSAGLILDAAGSLYGTTKAGGVSTGCSGGCGVVFRLSPNGSGAWTETVLRTFQPGATAWGDSNGGQPQAGVFLGSSGNLFGTTISGGNDAACSSEGCGVVFELSPTASGEWTETVLQSFSGGADGRSSLSTLTPGLNGELFGTAYSGGNMNDCSGFGCGAVYQITP